MQVIISEYIMDKCWIENRKKYCIHVMNNHGRSYIVLQALHDFNAIMTQVKLSQVHKILESLQLRDAITLLGRNRCYNINREGKHGLKKHFLITNTPGYWGPSDCAIHQGSVVEWFYSCQGTNSPKN